MSKQSEQLPVMQIRSRDGSVLYAGRMRLADLVAEAISIGITLTNANLTNANLPGANLAGAYLTNANLTNANLTNANLPGANLAGADLFGANLTNAYLTNADLTRANLTSADLTRANLTSADLTRANLTSANLTRANLTSANLTNAYLTDANLTRANLTNANLAGADLTNAYLTNANLTNADLTDANLTRALGIDVWRTTPLMALTDQPGTIRLYKLVTRDGMGPYNGGIRYEIGRTYEVDDACTNPQQQCAAGINIATMDWCLRRWRLGYRILMVDFTAGDIAAIPIGTDGKIRLHRCHVAGEVDLVARGLIKSEGAI